MFLVHVHRLPVAERGSKPRNNELCTVCCNETIYVSLRDSTNRAFLNPIQLPRAFVHMLKSGALYTPQKTDDEDRSLSEVEMSDFLFATVQSTDKAQSAKSAAFAYAKPTANVHAPPL